MKTETYVIKEDLENLGTIKLVPPPKTNIILITVDHEDGSHGTVELLWDRKKAILELEIENCLLDDGAEQLFNCLKEYIEDWQLDFYNDRIAMEERNGSTNSEVPKE